MNRNNIRRGLSVALAVAAVFAAQAAWAAPLKLTDGDTIKLDRVGAFGGGFGGGEFRVSGVSVLNGAGDSFLTFCVEYSEHISLNTNYYVGINTQAVQGGLGVSGYGSPDPDGVLNSYDPLSKGTAWLYTQFRNNTLDTSHGVAYNFAPDNAHANSLQLAIWSLEDELKASTGTLAAFNADLVAQDWASVAKTQGALWSDTGNVRVLNLYDTYANGTFGGNRQDQLYLAPVPEPGTYAMMLAGLALMGFIVRRRRNPGLDLD